MSSISESASAPASSGLPPLRRVITTHDADGKAVFSEEIPQTLTGIELPGLRFHLGYTLNQSPGLLNNDQDLEEYKDRLPHNVGISIPGGTVLRIVDFLPEESAPMHRTKTVDFGVVMEGEIELILDSGESTILKRGDIIVQRGTIHAWRNNSATEVARGFFVLVDAVLPTVNGVQPLHLAWHGKVSHVRSSAGVEACSGLILATCPSFLRNADQESNRASSSLCIKQLHLLFH